MKQPEEVGWEGCLGLACPVLRLALALLLRLFPECTNRSLAASSVRTFKELGVSVPHLSVPW